MHGVLLLDKPAGMTSNGALQVVRRLFRANRAGHTGTLDPLATGLLPVCFGEATKFGASLLEAHKAYEAEILLGVTTATGDAEGETTARRPVSASRSDVDRACAAFVGTIVQVPPMHSALKHAGRPLYAYARAGVEIERQPRTVEIRSLDVLSFDGERVAIRVLCSKGTYIRTLAEDIGAALGCGAHLTRLRRIGIGRFAVDEAIGLEALAALPEAARDARLLPVDALAADLPRLDLDADRAGRLAQGQEIRVAPGESGRRRAYAPGDRFLGVVQVDTAGVVRAERLLATPAAPARETPAGACESS